MNLVIRPERPGDVAGDRGVLEAAFPRDVEARLVERLRQGGKVRVSLVADLDGRVVGHILFSPVSIAGREDPEKWLGLAPLAVLPSHQRRGIGSRLVREGLAVCRESGCTLVVVFGEPRYYGRFGFVRASKLRLGNEYGVDDPFMALELQPGAVGPEGGLVRHAEEFAGMGP